MSRGILALLLGFFALILSGCAYRLPPYVPQSTDAVRIIATTPEQYILNINTETTASINVPNDGRVLITVPAYRSCGVYLFNVIKLREENDPIKNWTITVSQNGKTLRKVSFSKVNSLPTDNKGYHIWKINN